MTIRQNFVSIAALCVCLSTHKGTNLPSLNIYSYIVAQWFLSFLQLIFASTA